MYLYLDTRRVLYIVVQLVVVVVVVAVLARVLVLARRRVSALDVRRWSVLHGVPLSDADTVSVRGYLQRSRSWSWGGFAVPLAVAAVLLVTAVVDAVLFPPPPSPDSALQWGIDLIVSPWAWAVGYLVGAAIAEYRWARPTVHAVSQAAVAPRRLSQYLPSWVSWTVRLAPVACAAVLATGVLVTGVLAPTSPRAAVERDLVGTGVETALSVAVAVGVEVALRTIVARSQPALSAHAVNVDDGIRSTAAHRLAGAAVAAQCWSLAAAVAHLSAVLSSDGGSGPGQTAAGIGILAWLGLLPAGLVLWVVVDGSRPWRVRRVIRSAPQNS
jgi:hypothetical protein